MAKATKSVKASVDLILKILIGLLFFCIGIQGLMGENTNDLFRYLYRQSEVFSIILGVVLLLCGILLVVPLFVKGISSKFVTISIYVILVAWILIILLTDFVYGFKGVSGAGWFNWIENFIYHVLILSCIWKIK